MHQIYIDKQNTQKLAYNRFYFLGNNYKFRRIVLNQMTIDNLFGNFWMTNDFSFTQGGTPYSFFVPNADPNVFLNIEEFFSYFNANNGVVTLTINPV